MCRHSSHLWRELTSFLTWYDSEKMVRASFRTVVHTNSLTGNLKQTADVVLGGAMDLWGVHVPCLSACLPALPPCLSCAPLHPSLDIPWLPFTQHCLDITSICAETSLTSIIEPHRLPASLTSMCQPAGQIIVVLAPLAPYDCLSHLHLSHPSSPIRTSPLTLAPTSI